MTRLVINPATTPNNGLGNGLFTSFKNCDSNFIELYAGGVSLKFPRVAARYYGCGQGKQAAGAAQAVGTTVFTPIWVPASVTVTRLLANVTTTKASGLFQRAIYAVGATGKPTGLPLLYTVSMSTTSVGVPTTGTLAGGSLVISAAANLLVGYYYLGLMVDATANAAIFAGVSAASTKAAGLCGSTTAVNAIGPAMLQGYSCPQTFGTWSDVTAATFTDITTALIPIGGYLASAVL